MTLDNTSTTPKATLWVWPTGLYPRRIMYYLKAKKLPASILENLTIIPVSMDYTAGTLKAQDGFEPRPSGSSLPVLRVEDHMIWQSSSILTYFEDLFGPSLSGRDGIHRAHVSDIVQHINESSVWSNVYVLHGMASSLQWSGMTREQQSISAAEDALKRWKNAMAKLETWVKDDVLEKKSKSIAGGDEPTLADFTLMAMVTYISETYNIWDPFEGCSILQEWCERAKSCEWFMDREALERIEKQGFAELFSAQP